MPEHKSPPGPREMVQEWKTINTYSLPGFENEGAAVGVDGNTADHVALEVVDELHAHGEAEQT